MKTVTAAATAAKLIQWQNGQLSAPELHSWAEATYAVDAWEPETEAVNEVLAQLDMMNMNLLTVEDIPVLLMALKSENFVVVLDDYFSTIDLDARRRTLASNPMYAPFCKGAHDD